MLGRFVHDGVRGRKVTSFLERHMEIIKVSKFSLEQIEDVKPLLEKRITYLSFSLERSKRRARLLFVQ
jgi:hypothetical protein